MDAPIRRKKAKNAFTVGLSPDMRTLNIKILDFEAMCRPSTRKDVHEAVVQHLNRIKSFSQTLPQGTDHGN
jgi:hypothetical protein